MQNKKLKFKKAQRIKGAKFYFLCAFVPLCLLPYIFIMAIEFSYAFDETHLDNSILPGCSACHRNHGVRATVMLERPKDELCFKCHGSIKTGVKGEAATDIYSVIMKMSNHPVLQTTQYHVHGEALPERSPSNPRHVSCYDCHNPHLSTKEKPLNWVRGYSGRGMAITRVENEFEVCYKCHSDSANLPTDEVNIAQKFDPGNASFHPIENVGRNSAVPSLKAPLSVLSIITCSDCHGNDDKGGPKGPHGSNHEFMLKENYAMESGAESPSAYELCYGCHERSSILNDESFKSHKAHVIYNNESCFACHDAHGSASNENLIYFDMRLVTANSLGQLDYTPLIAGKPRCSLSCHADGITYDHKVTDFVYCVNSNCPTEW